MSDRTEPDALQEGLAHAVEARLFGDETLSDAAKFLVLAALHGGSDDDFRTAAGQDGAARVVEARCLADTAGDLDEGEVSPARVFLSGIEAEGFRGIGPTARMPLKPGPGLTVIAGRNGCGKSSFAEAAEVAVTGTSHRWVAAKGTRTRNWRNLHHKDACRVALTLTEEGIGHTIVQTEWSAAATTFSESECWVQRHSRPRDRDRAELGWTRELETYKPFLSHAELGEQLAEGGRTRLYSAINSALGLERIDATVGRLVGLVSEWGLAQKESDTERKALRAEVATLDDDRAHAVHRSLGKTKPDLAALADYATGQDDGSRVAVLRRLSELPAPDVEAFGIAVAQFTEARTAQEKITDAGARQDARRRDLLRDALAHHRQHGPETCPVCASGTLDAAWALRTEAELAAGDESARAAERARAEYRQAAQSLLALRAAVPPALIAAHDDPIPQVDASLTDWRTWADLADADALATEMAAATMRSLDQSLADLRAAAQQEFDRIQDDWQPVALRLAHWLPTAKQAEAMREKLADATAALDWMRNHADAIRNQRLEPINERTQRIWELLRQDSSVSLGPLELKGAGNRRRVDITTSVDGETDGAGTDALSQGELNALALALFLPRVDLVASPFGFVLIDDPVQAMDPAKVDGLARVLSQLAETRQVVVFTHDDRLPEAVQRLQIPATVLAVNRQENSVVTVHESSDPVTRYLEQALVIARDEDIPLDVRRRVVPGLCRSALERRCKEIFYRRELRGGAARNDVEQQWQQARQTKNRLMLVVNGPGESNLNRWLGHASHRHGALGACSSAVHHGWDGDPTEAVDNTKRVVTDLARDHG